MLATASDSREQLYEAICQQHGGYWRHHFVDHAYLYNLYFPPEPFFNQLTRHIHELVQNYPVGQEILAGLVGDLIAQSPSNIIVGNGAAELIKIVSAHLSHRLIVPVPSFNEYANAAPPGQVVEFHLDPPTFQLNVDQFAAEAIRCKADVAVVVTPNNPTSIRVPKVDLMRLLEKLAQHNCILIVDESFLDFAPDGHQQSLEGEVHRYPNLAILKSMSKAYGICGLRVGYMLTANASFHAHVSAGLHIWNLNGFAEAFLRAAPTFRQEFAESCRKVRSDRDLLFKELSLIDGMIVFKPDANFVFCRLPSQALSGPELTRRLFIEHNIYIKHCQGKTLPESDRYLRIASRTPSENQKIARTIRNILVSETT